jgi:hypothetical protein
MIKKWIIGIFFAAIALALISAGIVLGAVIGLGIGNLIFESEQSGVMYYVIGMGFAFGGAVIGFSIAGVLVYSLLGLGLAAASREKVEKV